MLNIKKILIPIDLPHAPQDVIHQAAILARHFRSEIVFLHVITQAESISELSAREDLAELIKKSGPDLDGLTIDGVVVKGNPAQEILRAAQHEKADLVMMASHGVTFNQFLLRSVSARVTAETECPIWTGAHLEELPPREFAIRNVLCAVDFRTHSRRTVSWAMGLANKFGARLRLAHVTPDVEFWGPGGTYVNEGWKAELVGDAAQRMSDLQRDMGIKVETCIRSGDVPKVLSQCVKEMGADLLVTGSRPYGGHLRTHGYAVICAVPIPVLNV